MNALLIHPDGRAEPLMGSWGAESATLSVLTQAGLAALQEAAQQAGQPALSALQLHHETVWVTLLPWTEGRWLRVEHEAGVSADQVQQWARQNVSALAVPAVVASPRVPSLADALNVPPP